MAAREGPRYAQDPGGPEQQKEKVGEEAVFRSSRHLAHGGVTGILRCSRDPGE